MAITKDITLNW